MTEILKSDKDGIEKAANLLKNDELVAFPTETVYGLGAVATNDMAIKQVFKAKGRPSDNPLIVHVADIATVEKFAENIPESFYQLIEAFWPGSLTLILEATQLPKSVTAGLKTAAFRMPDSKITLELIKTLGMPIVGPSANTSGRPSPTEAEHVYHDLNGKIAAILDGGQTRVGIESTVVDLTGKEPLILRPGAVTLEDLQEILPTIAYDQHLVVESEIPKAPGMKYQHYAPKVPVYMVDLAEISNVPDIKSIAVLCDSKFASDFKYAPVFKLTENNDIKLATHHLYRALREMDQSKFTAIFVQTFATKEAISYMNRLNKASGGKRFDDYNAVN